MSRRSILVRVTADEATGAPFTDEDLLAAVQAAAHEVYPVDDGMPVVPTVELLALREGPDGQASVDLEPLDHYATRAGSDD